MQMENATNEYKTLMSAGYYSEWLYNTWGSLIRAQYRHFLHLEFTEEDHIGRLNSAYSKTTPAPTLQIIFDPPMKNTVS